jgi:hypothetical protein
MSRKSVDTLLEVAQQCFDEGNTKSGLDFLRQAYALSKDPRIKELIEEASYEGGSDYTSPERPGAGSDDPMEMLADLLRRDKEGISTRKPKQDDIYSKSHKQRVEGLGEFENHRTTKGWRGEERFSEVVDSGFIAECGCILDSKNELGGSCYECNRVVCKKHILQCFKCNKLICNEDAWSLDGKPHCYDCVYDEHGIENLRARIENLKELANMEEQTSFEQAKEGKGFRSRWNQRKAHQIRKKVIGLEMELEQRQLPKRYQ